ncbi:MAG: hypothetical protein C5S38_06655 [Candidatus Methanophagaceae archaeon]|nr:MAG: hypothetical protein C5S38_06655 [Methanophagales archaeon]
MPKIRLNIGYWIYDSRVSRYSRTVFMDTPDGAPRSFTSANVPKRQPHGGVTL